MVNKCLIVAIGVVGTSLPCARSGIVKDTEAYIEGNVAVPENLLSDKMLRDLSPLKRAECVWDGTSSDPALIDEVAFQSAIENSSGWIRAVLRPKYVPDDLEGRIRGVVDDVMGWDTTRVRFDSQGLRLLVTQTASHISVVVSPPDEAFRACCGSLSDPEGCLRATLESVFRHARAILHMSRDIDEVP